MRPAGIYGICLVKDEDDIIAESLTFAAKHCERVFIIDNGSTDETWTIVQDLARHDARIVPFAQVREPFNNGLRAQVYNALHGQLTEHDWWQIVDADEFLAEDPRPVIAAAVATGADTIKSWQIQFYFTERDAEQYERGGDRRDHPIAERRRHYAINWQESRLFRNDPRREWDAASAYNAIPDWLARVARRRILNRHYRYRDPVQIDKRLRLRLGHHQFPHVRSQDWRSVVRDSRTLTVYRAGDPWHFSASGIWYFYRRHLSARLRASPRAIARRIRTATAPS